MVQFALAFVTGGLALIGLFAIVLAATARSARRNRAALRTAQVSLALAGVFLIIGYFIDGEATGLFGGLLLIVFGTGMTAIRGRSDPTA